MTNLRICFLQTIILFFLPLGVTAFNISLLSANIDSTKEGKINQQAPIPHAGYSIKTVVIDPGHGGHDPGCLGSSSREKHIALAVGRKLRDEFNRRYPQLNVIMTRSRDVFVPLHERASIANRNNADLFISIHCNFFPSSSSVHGSETYVMGLHTAEHNLEVAKRENSAILLEDNYQQNYDYDPNSPEGHIIMSMYQNAHLEQSILFAEKVEEMFAASAQRRSRGVKQAGFVVLKNTAMPSVLVETGFLSNWREEQFLNTARGQQTVAGAIVDAFDGYRRLVEGNANGTRALQAVEQPQAVDTKAERVVAKDHYRIPPQNRSSTPPKKQEYKPADQLPEDPYGLTSDYQPETAAAEPREQETSPASSKKSTPEKRLGQGDDSGPSEERAGDQSQSFTADRRWPAPVQEEDPATESTNEAAEISATGPVQFTVQLAASPKPLNTTASPWRDVRYPIEVIQEDNLYKYQVRNFQKMDQALNARFHLRASGFTDAFIVAYKGKKRISIPQAKRELGIK